MPGTADLMEGAQALIHDEQRPTLLVGEVLDATPLRVKIPSLDGGAQGRRAFGTWPDATPGDEVRVMFDERGRPVVVAWEASGA